LKLMGRMDPDTICKVEGGEEQVRIKEGLAVGQGGNWEKKRKNNKPTTKKIKRRGKNREKI